MGTVINAIVCVVSVRSKLALFHAKLNMEIVNLLLSNDIRDGGFSRGDLCFFGAKFGFGS